MASAHKLSQIVSRVARSAPFVAVALCFLLPFFSVSSCDAGTETDATGFQIVAGSRLIQDQVKQPVYLIPDDGSGSRPVVPHVPLGPNGPDAQAQAIADAARPWVALTLIVVALGGYLVVIDRRWRAIRTIAAGLASSTWIGAAVAADHAAPTHSSAEFNVEWGFLLPLLILIVTCVWGRARWRGRAAGGWTAPRVSGPRCRTDRDRARRVARLAPAMADWVTISSLATAGGTLVLAVATFSSVKSANRSARVAERSLLAGIRPVLMPSQLDDAPVKVGFADNRWLLVPGGGGAAEVAPEAVYVAMSLRNAGNGIAVLHGWTFWPERVMGSDAAPPRVEDMHRLTRDIYIPTGQVGFWQGVFRDPGSEEFMAAADALAGRVPVSIDVLYGDHEGGQRTITRFGMMPRQGEDATWIVAAARHWNLDREDPR